MASNSIIIEKIETFIQINEDIKTNIKLLHVFKDYLLRINVILVTNEDKVYCFGRNINGVLGFRHHNDVDEFTINDDLSNKSITHFKNGLDHTIARDSNGKLYCWGRNRYLGNVKKNYYGRSKPELNKYLIKENIIEMCCGFGHTLVLTSNNEVYGWGHNERGQIGNRSSGEDALVLIPFKVNDFNGEKVEMISCGRNHSMALTESGSVYSWGCNRSGQLGLNSENEIESNPKHIPIEIKFKKISCGESHTLLLSREGDIYVFGNNKYKQLGIETNEEKQLTPIKLNHSEKFIDIASHYGYDISAALSQNGLYYVWGDCGKNLIISEPTEVQFKSFEEILISFTEFADGKYINWREILPEIGCGSYGKVFKVKHNIFRNQSFTIKKIPIGEKLWSDYSIKELDILDLLKDENEFVVKYYDGWFEQDFKLINGKRIYSENHTIYIRMELCDKTLSTIHEEIQNDSKLFSNNSLTLLGYYLLSELFIQILKGVKYLHKNNIIHRDLHLNNILVKSETNGNCIRIADFGLAKVHEMNTSHTKDRGHVRYQAPELGNSRKYDTKADIYSLGVILEELFEIDFNKSINDYSDMTPKCECLEELHERMTMRNPRKRPNCDQILEETENWAINEREFNFIEELNILLGISEENRSYVQNIIVSKLSHTKQNFC